MNNCTPNKKSSQNRDYCWHPDVESYFAKKTAIAGTGAAFDDGSGY